MTVLHHPPEIAELINKYDGIVWSAEQAVGVYRGFFSKVARGGRYTDDVKTRVLAALDAPKLEIPKEDKKTMTSKKAYKATIELPETCPPLLGDLIRFKGSKASAAKALGTSESALYKRINGELPMPPEWEIKAKVALGQPVIKEAAQPEMPAAPPVPEGPPFVLWDGKVVTIKVKGMHGQPLRTLKGVPTPIAKLIEKHGGSRAQAAQATGHSAGWMNPFLDNPKAKFKEKPQRVVHAALHDLPIPQNGDSAGGVLSQDFDKYTLGIAIVFASANLFDRVNEIADILQGRLVYKRNTKSGWIFIYKMAIDDLPRFKKLVSRDASDVVCP